MTDIRILVVEDERIVAEDIKRSLQGIGYTVVGIESSGEGAIKKAEESKPDLVLMDIVLKGKMNGIEAAEILMKKYGTPVIYLTAYADQETLSRAKITEPYGYVLKPFDERFMESTIEMAIYKHGIAQKLKDSEEKYRTLQNNVPVGIFSASINGTFLSVNTSLVRLFGFNTIEEIMEVQVRKLFRDQYERKQIILELNNKGNINDVEIELLKKDGYSFWATISATAIMNRKGQIIHYDGIICDITERKKAEDAVKQSEAKYKDLVEKASVAICSDDRNGTIIFYNEKFADLFGYTTKEMESINHNRLIHPDELQKVKQIHENRMLGRDAPSRYKFRGVKKDGSDIYVELAISSVLKDEGSIIGSQSYLWDVTASKHAEEALRESEEKFRSLSDQSMMGIVIIQDGYIKYVNRAASEITGYSEEEFMSWGQGAFIQAVHPDHREFIMNQYNLKIASSPDAIASYSYRMITPDGSIRWLEQYSKAIQYQGQIADLATFTDITDRKRIEEIRLESERKYRQLVDNSLVGIYIIQDEHLKFCNQRLADIFGYSNPGELSGKHVNELVDESDIELVRERAGQRANGDEPISQYEFKGIKKDGTMIDLEVLGSRITFQGKPAIQGSLIDISAQKIALAKQIELEKMKSDFILLSSHELATPLMVIEQWLDNLKDDLEAITGLKRTAYEVIMSSIGRLKKLKNAMTNMVLLEQGKFKPKKEPLFLHYIAQNVILQLCPIAEEKEIELRSKLSHMGVILADRDSMHQVITILLHNAIIYTPNGGWAEITGYEKEDYVEIIVKDNGIGIPREEQERIFDRFHQVEDIMKHKRGFGLGLSSARGIIEAHGGKIWVESKVGKGSHFFVRIPKKVE